MDFADLCQYDEAAITAKPLLVDPAGLASLDPFQDAENDATLPLTARELLRVATVAADVAQRFQREGTPRDPVAWMLAPRRLFDGDPALLACRSAQAFSRAIVLHGLSLGLDADPREIDDLLNDDDGDDRECPPFGWATLEALQGPSSNDRPSRRLFTAIIDLADARESLAFCALTAGSRVEAERRLAARYGRSAVAAAAVVDGVDRDDPRVDELVPSSLLVRLLEMDAVPSGADLDLTIERRFA
ncbi:hypothetical protein SAMN06297144_1182 [Sphingomonas guangdongensis]|uniref:Uncharacterized protein n=1 Tax=Sphingomonas guangdongensis TaxID=1141890 RepID=A0A285QGT2_9SPHN|nr:hypothetical protein [Sphingomonas guangdongensis]SOB80674.1 hypothetical protein SAMN06297144_1182 [Sphingomonas guangdongensis]